MTATIKELADLKARRSDLIVRLRGHGLQFVGYSRPEMSTETIEAVVRVLDEASGGSGVVTQ